MNLYATISADIVASTSLSKDALVELTTQVKGFLNEIAPHYAVGFWGRLVKGDSIECVMEHPKDALRIAIMLKALIKSVVPSDGITDPKFKQFGLRIAIGIGEMRLVDRKLDMMDGEAIYQSGRALMDMQDKTKDSFQIVMKDDVTGGALPVISVLLNQIINKATSRQCETLYHRLQCRMDAEVAEKMNITRPGVNQNLNNMGWDAIERSVNYFEQLKFEGK